MRDETANMAWAMERIVENAAGDARRSTRRLASSTRWSAARVRTRPGDRIA